MRQAFLLAGVYAAAEIEEAFEVLCGEQQFELTEATSDWTITKLT